MCAASFQLTCLRHSAKVQFLHLGASGLRPLALTPRIPWGWSEAKTISLHLSEKGMDQIFYIFCVLLIPWHLRKPLDPSQKHVFILRDRAKENNCLEIQFSRY